MHFFALFLYPDSLLSNCPNTNKASFVNATQNEFNSLFLFCYHFLLKAMVLHRLKLVSKILIFALILLYLLTFFSGFGHLSPGTDLGKVICIVYSLLGVPINGILIGSLGAFFGGKVKLNLTFMALFSFIAYSTVSQIDHTV